MMNFQQPQLLSSIIARAHGATSRGIDAFVQTNLEAAMDHIQSTRGAEWSGEHADGSTMQNLDQAAKTALVEYYWNGNQSAIQGRSGANTNVAGAYNRPDDHEGTFDIYITYGDYFGGQARENYVAGSPAIQQNTIRRLSDVVITGIGSTITVAGEPVLESYPFMCREVR